MTPRHLVSSAFAAALMAGACTHPKTNVDPNPKYRAVHVDHLDPEKRPAFEAARRDWLGALRQAGLTDGRGFFIEAGSNTFYTLHPFEDFHAYARLLESRKVAPAKLPDACEAYDRVSDEGLLPPHRSEVWSAAPHLEYRPTEGALDEFSFVVGRMEIDDVRPGPRGDGYYEAWEELRAALRTAGHPLTHLAFSSRLGSGKVIGLWLAKSRAALESAPSPEAAVERVLGPERARQLWARLRESVVGTETFEITRRPELDSP